MYLMTVYEMRAILRATHKRRIGEVLRRRKQNGINGESN